MRSSVSSKLSSISSPLKFNNKEGTKRVSNISVESLDDYNKRKSDGKFCPKGIVKSIRSIKNEESAVAAPVANSKMSIYHDVEKAEEPPSTNNLFRNVNSPPSESSEAYTFVSAPKFGGAVTNSERGSIAHSFKSPYFKVEQHVNDQQESLNNSSKQNTDRQESMEKRSNFSSEFHF